MKPSVPVPPDGRNERVAVKDVYASKAFLYQLVKELAGHSQAGARLP